MSKKVIKGQKEAEEHKTTDKGEERKTIKKYEHEVESSGKKKKMNVKIRSVHALPNNEHQTISLSNEGEREEVKERGKEEKKKEAEDEPLSNKGFIALIKQESQFSQPSQPSQPSQSHEQELTHQKKKSLKERPSHLLKRSLSFADYSDLYTSNYFIFIKIKHFLVVENRFDDNTPFDVNDIFGSLSDGETHELKHCNFSILAYAIHSASVSWQ
jgi:hypothetical protein